MLVINLDRRPDRWERFQAAWKGLLPEELVTRFPAVDGRLLEGAFAPPWFRGGKRDAVWAGRAGCTLSHAGAMRLARSKGWKRTLVMEDDAEPTAYWPLGATAALEAEPGPDIVYLGCHTPRRPFSVANGFMRMEGALELHAYVVNPRAAKLLADTLPTESTIWPWLARERAVDRFVDLKASATLNVACAHPMLVTQRADASDITQRTGGSIGGQEFLIRRPPTRLERQARRMARDVADQGRATVKRLTGL